MSFGRKTYDGDLLRGSISDTERRDTLDSKSPLIKLTSSKRTGRNSVRFTLKEDQFHEEPDKDRYLITYADLITLLLGLFIILYTISNIDSKKYQKISSAIGSLFGSNTTKITAIETAPVLTASTPQVKLKGELTRLITENNYQNSIRLEENPRGITIHILDDILFSSGKAKLTENSLHVLDKISKILSGLPNDIRIEGHTDNVPINTSEYPSNWHLSVSRALNTAYYLIENQKLPPEKVSVVGHSEYQPVSSNNTASGRANNRRVDIVIIN